MNNTETPTLNKTPFRRLGLVRRRTTSLTAATSTTANTPTSAIAKPMEYHTPSEKVFSSDSRAMRPIRSTCSIGDDSDDDKDDVSTAPVTPVNTKSVSKKTRLSLSQSWRNKIAHKKQMLQVKRRKLLSEVEMCSEPDVGEDTASNEDNAVPSIEESSCAEKSVDLEADSSKPSSIRQRIQEVKESINVWRAGCIQALNDLQERRGSGDMESLLNLLQIPFELVNYDRETQEFLDPD